MIQLEKPHFQIVPTARGRVKRNKWAFLMPLLPPWGRKIFHRISEAVFTYISLPFPQPVPSRGIESPWLAQAKSWHVPWNWPHITPFTSTLWGELFNQSLKLVSSMRTLNNRLKKKKNKQKQKTKTWEWERIKTDQLSAIEMMLSFVETMEGQG